ncbi:tRNA (adenosine(37)-N6)-threonylcarbamoyltransferase complex transferase subunit TsaD [Candidatus Falkowbacteria bacterium CG10_big_fil_rev_8_21_14_0_10_39_11]|uniref:tRNA N6-adenosine threonylcarbamoyltransferase n=1 Tax=Candidatus Falkowbacteria bacterium CG10_big_fil_rev_8_21_14_0_10_39_11 TaxID=1974565 RepID=A0A2H0V4F1_9BACT|nr:MAG: tRNA (adenosine(37)-N6)-threonylcarbamoyltransferase complex transferase subunit TsaD [Candidatus Falkowbacteria bacterium CG10_big_fil_rev_8_21_14_0_10_39_11]
MSNPITILAIESSCDETAAAVLEFRADKVAILSDLVSSQVKTHAKYGGVIPEVAARMHIKQIIPIVDTALKEAAVNSDIIDAIAVTGGPGLIPSLLVGVETAKSLSLAWNKPLIKVNHIEGHVFSSLLNENLSELKNLFPALCLVVSGGHTDLILVKNFGDYERVGGTRDDAVGEAYDKVAKMMDLGYPGGPIISKLASEVTGSPFELPRPMIDSTDFDMSFSGIKTSVLYKLQKYSEITDQVKKEMSFEFEQAVSDVLVTKTIKAAKQFDVKSILIGGGVAANKTLRDKLQTTVAATLKNTPVKIPEIKYTGDNAVMIGFPAYFHYLNKNFTDIKGFRPDPNWELV